MGSEVGGWGWESPQVSPGAGRADLDGERVIQAEDTAAQDREVEGQGSSL